MHFNLFKTSFRSITKRPGYSFLNIASLGLGLGCFILIMLFVTDELSYDTHHKDADRIYRVALTGQPLNSEPDHFAVVSSAIGRYVRQDFPQVESLVRLMPFSPTVLHEGTYYFDDRFYYAEPSLFDVFTLPLVAGQSESQLERPNTAVMTESMARKYFNTENVVGQTITVDDSTHLEITGVIEDIPSTSHFRADYFVSYSTFLQRVPENESWLDLGQYAYLKAAENVDIGEFQARLKTFAHEKIGEELDQFGFKLELDLEPLTAIYLTSKRDAQIGATGDMTQVWVFSGIAMFILLLGIINFTNLATARSFERAKEVGVRKSVGSSKGALVGQFLGESSLMAFISLLVGFLIAAGGLPILNDIAGKEIEWFGLLSPQVLLICISATLLSGLLGGAYPAFVLSSFKSVDVLKGVFHASNSSAFVRKGLVSLQFAISIGLISGTVIVVQQIEFLQAQDLGFSPDQVLVIDGQTIPREQAAENRETLLSQFSGLAGVQMVAYSETIPGRRAGRVLVNAEGLAEDDVRSVERVRVGYDYFETLGIKVSAGRLFSRDFADEEAQGGVLVNEEAVRYFGWESPEAAIGKTVGLGGGRRVVGVVSDYHHESLKNVVQPTVYNLFLRSNNYLSIKLAGSALSTSVDDAKAIWTSFYPEYPFESFFLDDDFNKQYQAEERLMNVFYVFSFLATIIACMGLFGLAAFTAAQRTKEIGVRKVMGASVRSIVRLLSTEFMVLVGVGLLIAVPVTSYSMGVWLEPFKVKVPISWWVFVLSGLGAVLIALATVSFQAIRAASADPIRSLRYE